MPNSRDEREINPGPELREFLKNIFTRDVRNSFFGKVENNLWCDNRRLFFVDLYR
jgi:folate-binding Fe-S cluster repair protein YgfZ